MNSNTLPSFLSVKIVVVLEDALERLSVLHCTNEYLIRHSKYNINESISGEQNFLRHSRHAKHISFYSQFPKTSDINQNEKIENYQKIVNIEEDRNFIEICLEKLRKDLETNGEYTHFSQILRDEQDNELRFANQKVMNQKFNTQILNIQNAIDIFQKETNDQKEKLNLVRQNLKHQKQELIQKRKMQLQFVQAQIRQSFFEVQKECENGTKEVTNDISMVQQLFDEEKRSYKSGIECFRQSFFNIINDEDQFIKYYNTMKERIKESIHYYNKHSNVIKGKLNALYRKYKDYIVVVEEDRIWKEELKKEENILNFRTENAVSIQKWWRWLIVKDNLLSKPKKKKSKKKN